MARRLFEHIYFQIRRDIAHGRLRPGDKLPAERDLAEQHGVGRPVTREALRALEAAGILQFKKGINGGAFVRKGDPHLITRSISDLLFLGTFTLQNIMEVRASLLVTAVKLACERGSDADFDRIEIEIVNSAEALTDIAPVDAIGIINGFYAVLGQATHNPALSNLIMSTTEVMSQILIRHEPRFIPDLVSVRRELLVMLRERDSDGAVEVLSRHLKYTHDLVLKRVPDLHELALDPSEFHNNRDGSQ